MDKKKVYLFEISDIFANQVYIPYCSGVVWSYAINNPTISYNYELAEWFYHRQNVEDIIDQIENPDILAFSCFMWNWNINCEIAERIKKKHPDCIVVFGGQHQPLGDRNNGFFAKNPFVDILVHGEGEVSFMEILETNLGLKSVKKLNIISSHEDHHLNETDSDDKNYKFIHIPGITVNLATKEYKTAPRPRLPDIGSTPSPYLNGLFDNLLEKNKNGKQLDFDAVIESARGCPYLCAFCEIGEKYYQKIKTCYNKSKKEIKWIAENQIEYVTDANSNFGLLYDQDYDLAKYVKSIKETYSYPMAYRVTWAKGRADKVLDIAKIFEAAGVQRGMTIALQSMNPDVLKAIKRKNIDDGKLGKFISMYEGANIASYVELIWGLPEETLESFIDGVSSILEAGFHNYLDIHLMMLLPNAPIASKEFINEYKIGTSEVQPRFAHRHITDKLSKDTAHFVTECGSFSREDWIKGYLFRWVVIFGHYLGPLQFIARGLHRACNVPYKDFYLSFLDFAKNNPNTFIGKEYQKILANIHKILNNERHWGDVISEAGTINWSVDEATCIRIALSSEEFFRELELFMGKNYPKLNKDLRNELIKYQKFRTHSPYKNYPQKEIFTYNLHESIENNYKIKKRKNKLLCSGKNYNSDIFKWAKETLWYGRRVAKYKTSAYIL